MNKNGLAFLTGCLILTAMMGSRSQSISKADTPLKVAELLDCIIQARFQQDAGKFGIERIEIAGHDGIYDLAVKTPQEKKLLAAVKASKRDYAIGFSHCRHKPGRFLPPSKTNSGTTSESVSEGASYVTLAVQESGWFRTGGGDGMDIEKWVEKYGERVDNVVTAAMPRLKQGRDIEANAGRWLVVMRPVRALKTSCLGCHTGAKPGDTLGVMVYAVDRRTKPHS